MRNFPPGILILPVLAVLAIDVASLQAQPPRPRIDWLYPAGGKAGNAVPVEISGADLDGLVRLIVSDDRLKPARADDGKWTITIAPDTPIGQYELRGVATWGVTNPVPFVVGRLDEINETEPNDQNPQELKFPVTVNGRIQSAADVDRFVVHGKKGQRIAIVAKADAFDSPLDGAIRIFGPRGNPVSELHDGYDYDPRADLEFPEDGAYRIELFDAVYGGSPAHRYRLSIHASPTIDSLVPAAIEPGKNRQTRILGRGLGQDLKPAREFPAIDGIPELSTSFVLAENGLLPGKGRLGAYSYDDDPFPRWLSKIEEAELVEPIATGAAHGQVQAEIESNDTDRTAQKIQTPADLTGLFGEPGDVDWYVFDAEKGDSLVIDVLAQRLRSMAHPQLSLYRAMPDGSSQPIASSLDSPENPFGAHFEKATRDPRLNFTVPETGQYRVRVAHVNAREGDARYAYRVIVRRAAPEFRIIAMTADNGPAGTACFRGGRCVVSVLLDRIDGYAETVRVEAVDLPPGVKAWPVVFGPRVRKLEMVLEVAPEAQPGEFPLKLRGSTRWSDTKSSVDWVPGQKPETAAANSPESIGGYLVRPLVGPQNQQRGVSRYSADFWVAIRDTAVPFRMDPKPLRIFAKRGETVDLPIDAVRQNGFDAPIALRLDNLPAQMEAVTGELPKDKSEAVLKLKIGANVAPGRHTVHINGSGQFPFAKDPAAKEKPAIGWNQPSRPVTLIVIP